MSVLTVAPVAPLAQSGPVIPNFGQGDSCIRNNGRFCLHWFLDNFNERFELNSRVVKREGAIVEEVYRVGGRYDEQLSRSTEMAERGSLLARDRSVLAEGEGRTSAQPDVAAQVVGQLGPVPEERADDLSALGVPDDASVVLIKVEGNSAEYWDSPGGRLATVFSFAKAKVTGRRIEGGENEKVDL